MAGGELVEQLALHLGAGEPGGLLLELALQQLLELVEALRGPSDLAKSSSILVSPATFTALTVTSNVGFLALEILGAG